MSPRPKRYRKVGMPPQLTGFKPIGIPFKLVENISILFEEYEALRLADYDNLSQAQAAKKMNISRPTFARIYDSVRKKISQAFVEGKAIIIEGGDVMFDKQWYRCKDCYTVLPINKKKQESICTNCSSENIEHINESIKFWRMGKHSQYGANRCEQLTFCICTACGHKMPHKHGIPCKNIECPNCGNMMVRE